MSFFKKFPDFISHGTTGVDGRSLEHRYSAIIENQKDMFPGRTELDLASHDGRWSLTALEAGAQHVTGIEGRRHLALKSCKVLKKYGYGKDHFKVIVGDLVEKICTLEKKI